MIETEEESSDLDSNLTTEYGIRSYVVSDGGVVSRTSPELLSLSLTARSATLAAWARAAV